MSTGPLTRSDPDAERVLAEARRLYAAGQYGPVVRLCRELLGRSPQSIPALVMLGMAELAFDHFDESRAALNKAAALAPREPKVFLALAAAYRRQGRFAEAHSAVNRALEARPGDSGALAARATLLCMEGRYQEALDAVKDAAIDPSGSELAIAQVFGRACARLGRLDEGIAAIEGMLGRAGASGDRGAAFLQLGELLDARGDYDRAFEAFSQAAEIRRQVVRYDPAMHARAVEAAMTAWSPATLKTLPVSSVRGERMIFVVGMMRSGTTLVEQILACHPKVFGAGELLGIGRAAASMQPVAAGPVPLLTEPGGLTRAALERSAREFLGAVSRLDSRASRVVDKNPMNFLHLGLIRCMLPGARVIHCTRDPMDTCLSCFFNVSASIPFACDLSHLGAFFREYRRLMAHWRGVLDVPVLEVVYEDLVADPEGGARRIVEFAGLEWDPACARFHESTRVALTPSIDQVRRPMYTTSVGRWRRYERHLGPLASAIGGALA